MAVNRFLNLKMDTRQELQEIAELVAEICNTPAALITVMGHDTKYIKFTSANYNDDESHIWEDSFCAFLIKSAKELIVSDALLDKRFANNPAVTNAPHVRFYAGVPLTTHDGHSLGSLCILDTKPRQLSDSQLHLLKVLAKRIVLITEFDFSLNIMKEQYLEAKSSEMKLRSFFESSGSCHVLLGREMEILAFNKNMADFIEKMHYVSLSIGINICQILKDKHLETFKADYKKALNGKTVEFEREVNYRGELIWWHVIFEPQYDQQRNIIGVSYNATDITEQKQYEQQILAQNESLKKIAYVQSHELRRPVASIMGLMEIIKNENYKPAREELMMMEKAVQELDERIRNIVSMTCNKVHQKNAAELYPTLKKSS
ncbi:GAF domain-containing protein [Mucilaginibacter segetis]|uniref:histidine kinase n=1 Tax=Mucilaginibacter segetis TaxID=2793071 RepID=A0A934UMH5_9SPHI|nr:GAF domain-containing protein [Mucilaginibacter segetis]MBK0378892.1 PAS domain S-box protein [Mucilaginibacter segetis]